MKDKLEKYNEEYRPLFEKLIKECDNITVGTGSVYGVLSGTLKPETEDKKRLKYLWDEIERLEWLTSDKRKNIFG